MSRPGGERVVAGIGPVAELLRAAPGSIRKLCIAPGRERGRESKVVKLAARAQAAGIKVERYAPGELDKLADNIRHQGVVAVTRPFEYAELGELGAGGAAGLIVALDGVTDPHNLGAIARTALLLGAEGIVVPKDRSAEVTPTVTKASAGAVEHIPIARVTNLARALTELKQRNYWTVAIHASPHSISIAELDVDRPLCVVLGSEGSGVRPNVAKQCDFSCVIPMAATPVGSFNVSVAAAIALYDITSRRIV